jgi:transcriptional regulator with XRE-family HTH domain
MTPVPLLIHELERIAKDRHWSVRDLAGRLGISAKTLYSLRSGDTSLSLDVLARIIRDFDGYESVRRLALFFLAREYHAQGRTGHGRKSSSGGPGGLPSVIPYRDRWRISAWAAQVARSTDIRRGLYLWTANTSLLSAAIRYVEEQVEAHGVAPVMLAANARLTASHTDAAAHAHVLLVERVDHVSDAVAALLTRRGDALAATVVTSSVDREHIRDPHLVRLFRASMQAIALERTPKAAPPPHAPSRLAP